MNTQIKPGDKVHYTPSHGKKENGIVKSLTPDGEGAFVVYNCNKDWDNYQNYTGCSTNFRDLKPGWADMTNKKYILIQNDGEIESNSFELIGASTKRGQAGKIGFFGSGLKYSIAYMMRNGIDFKVFSGEKELVFTTIPETLKEQIFERICINGKPTSYTVTMGPTWKEDWFVLREIYCNSLDESKCQVVKETENVQPNAGSTRIYIELTDTLRQVIVDWDKYFSDERTPIFECEKIYTSSLGTSDGSVIGYQPVKVYPRTDGILYRRGINVAKKTSFLFDYELQFVNINEDRTAQNISSTDYMFADMIGQMTNEDWVKNILRTSQDDDRKVEYSSMTWHKPEQKPSEKWIEFSKENMLVVREISGRYADEIAKTKKEVFLIPSYFARELKKQLPAVSLIGMGTIIGDSYMSEVEKTAKMDFLLKEVIKSLNEMGYEVHYDITVVDFEDDAKLGQADVKEKKIYIAKKTFDMGRREIALTLIEENEHIKSGKGDETRAFQNHLISQWLTSMENQNGLFL